MAVDKAHATPGSIGLCRRRHSAAAIRHSVSARPRRLRASVLPCASARPSAGAALAMSVACSGASAARRGVRVADVPVDDVAAGDVRSDDAGAAAA